MTNPMQDKVFAMRRLVRILEHMKHSPDFDQEEVEHFDEIIRICAEDVPANYFEGFGDFRGADK